MKQHEDIFNELREISSAVAAVPYVNVFHVHEGYFAGTGAELKARIAADQEYASKNISVPEGYFDGLAAKILQKIKKEENVAVADEMTALSPVISAIGNANVFAVPQGYFEQLSFTAEVETAKVIKMNPLRSVFKYAVAAVITGLLGISIINLTDNNTTVETNNPVIQTASVAKTENVMRTANDIIQKGNFENEFNTISDKDIEHYLTQSGQDVNAALVASSADDATLPEATDYLLDENTLDEYLKKNNLNTNNLKN